MDIRKSKELLEEYRDDKLFGVAGREALGVVLSELEKKDKEIEQLKADNSHQWEERCKLTFELEKKEAIINEMAKQLAKLREERRGRLFYKPTYKCMRNKI